MVKLIVADQAILIPSEQLLPMLLGVRPEFLRPGGNASAIEVVIRTGIKSLMPFLADYIAEQMRKQGDNRPTPNKKSPEYRKDSIGYMIEYLCQVGLQMLASTDWIMEGEHTEDGYRITGIHPAVAVDGGYPALAAPTAAE